MVDSRTKTCPKCKRELALSQFWKNRARKDGCQSWCKSCFTKKTRSWYERNRERKILKDRERKLRIYYNLSQSDYENLLVKQNSVCAICLKCDSQDRLCVDHDHKTGKVRGLLCHKCNLALGNIDESSENLKRAIAYLS